MIHARGTHNLIMNLFLGKIKNPGDETPRKNLFPVAGAYLEENG